MSRRPRRPWAVEMEMDEWDMRKEGGKRAVMVILLILAYPVVRLFEDGMALLGL